jgi:hypothetical protein
LYPSYGFDTASGATRKAAYLPLGDTHDWMRMSFGSTEKTGVA